MEPRANSSSSSNIAQPNPNPNFSPSPNPATSPATPPTTSPTISPVASMPTSPATSVPSDSSKSPKMPLSRKTFYLVLSGVVLLLVVAIVIACIVIFSSQKSTPIPPVNPDPPEQIEDNPSFDNRTYDRSNVPESFGFEIVEDYSPGGSTTISIEGNQVIIEEYNDCSAVDCEGSTDEKTYEFSDENIVKLYEFYESEITDLVEESFDIGGDGEIFLSMLDSYQKSVFYALLLGEDEFADELANHQ